MSREHPRFDEPNYTVQAAELFGNAPLSLDDRGPLPTLLDPLEGRIVDPVDEPLVPVVHRRIRVLSNYWHAGWSTAVPTTWLRRSALERLATVAESLPLRWGLAVFDAWRPLELQEELFAAAYERPGMEIGFMAPPCADPAKPPAHLTGGAVDLTLTFDGTPIAPGSGFDDTSERAHTAHLEDDAGPARLVRRALFHHMADNEFVVYKNEWWHFEFGTRRWGALTGRTPFYGPAHPPITIQGSPE